MMKAEILCIGDELLIGQTINSNAAWMGQELNKIGIDVYQVSTISDDKNHIVKLQKPTSYQGLLLMKLFFWYPSFLD